MSQIYREMLFISRGHTNANGEDYGELASSYKRSKYGGFCSSITCKPLREVDKSHRRKIQGMRLVTNDQSLINCPTCNNALYWAKVSDI